MTRTRPLRPADKADRRRLWTGCPDFHGPPAPEEVLSRTIARLPPGGDPAMFALIAEGAPFIRCDRPS